MSSRPLLRLVLYKGRPAMSDQLNRDAILADYHFYARILDDLRSLLDHIPGLLKRAADGELGCERLDAAKRALVDTGYFTEDQVGDDIAPRIIELRVALDTGRVPDMDRSKP